MSLLSALYTGVSGLQTFGDSLQVIGDNIANVNTTAFKSARAEFADVLSQTINVASGRSQLGRGVTLSRVSSNFAQGSFSNTDRLTDLAINGNGFFVVTDGTQELYTRNGQFTIDRAGNMVTTGGLTLKGYQYDSSGVSQVTLGPLKINQAATQPKQTGSGTPAGTGVSLAVQLNADDPIKNAFSAATPATTSNFSTTMTCYDSQGNDHSVDIYFNKTADNNWSWHALVDGGDLTVGTAGTYVECATGTLTFDNNGEMTNATTTNSAFNFKGVNPQAIGFNFNVGSGTTQTKTAQYASPSVVHAQQQDGYAAGSLATVSVGEDGIITGTYTNGRTLPIGQIALANFSDLQGLRRAGSGLYAETSDSGVPVVSHPNVGGFGTISSYSLELSNVDLATEFVSLISTQRAYQANSKIITVGDQLLSEVVNIIR